MPISWNEIRHNAIGFSGIAGLRLHSTFGQSKGATLADLYDPIAMPPDLVKAHAALDRVVDLATARNPSRASASAANQASVG